MKVVSDYDTPNTDLMIWEDRSKKLQCFYAPFDYINPDAKIILVGLTPGKTQMTNALNSVIESYTNPIRADKDSILLKAKQFASFSNGARSKTQDNLIDILKKLGYEKELRISNLIDLWGKAGNQVQFCSVLKYPVFKNGGNYKDDPSSRNATPDLKKMINKFVEDLQLIDPNALLIPLGGQVHNVITKLNKDKKIPQRLKLTEFGEVVFHPHPSGESCHYKNLLFKPIYPDKEAYQDEMYQAYDTKSLKKSTSTKRPEDTYKKIVGTYWDTTKILRDAYGIM